MILIKNCCLYRNWLLSSIQFHVFDILPNVLNEETMSWWYFKNQSVPQSLLVYSKEIIKLYTVQFSSVQSLNHVLLFATPWIAARQASLSITNSQSLPKPMSVKLWCHPAISSSVIHFSSCRQSLPQSGSFPMNQLCMRWPKYWSFSFNISPSNEHPGLISFRMDWLDLLAVQGTLKSLLQNHSSKASIPWCSAFFTVQHSHPYSTIGKTIALTRRTSVG